MGHTVFNVANVILLCPAIPFLAWLCGKLIKGPKLQPSLDLEPRFLKTPDLALDAVERTFRDLYSKSFGLVSIALHNCTEAVDVDAAEIERAEDEIDRKRESIRAYLAKLSKGKLSGVQSRRIPALLHCVNDVERIADLGFAIFNKSVSMRFAEAPLSDLKGDVEKLRHAVKEYADGVRRRIDGDQRLTAESFRIRRRELEDVIQSVSFLGATLIREEGSAEEVVSYFNVLFAVKDIFRHLENVAERMAE